jgi:hypothetical protein
LSPPVYPTPRAKQIGWIAMILAVAGRLGLVRQFSHWAVRTPPEDRRPQPDD